MATEPYRGLSPAEIARETLRRLVSERRAPTPDNFRQTYELIAGVAPGETDKKADPLLELLSGLLESRLPAAVSEHDDLLQESRLLARRVRAAGAGGSDIGALTQDLRALFERVEERARGLHSLRDGLLRLLRLLVDSIGELVVEDTWITPQLEAVRDLFSQTVDETCIDAAERYLRDALARQREIRNGLQEAKAALRDMVARYLEQLGVVTSDTRDYEGKVKGYAERINAANDLGSLGNLVGDLLRDTRDMHARTATRHKELLEAHERAQAAGQRIGELEAELGRLGDKLAEDPLTGTLNRRGFDAAFARESARARRSSSPLSLALLDVDNFKQLNDRHGHNAGDQALVHLARVVKETLRPNDVVARHGGEEFVIMLPDTGLAEAEAAIVRLQRELTKRFFLHHNERLLITFSAGVTEWLQAEEQSTVLGRADAAQYRAKASGKNRVVAAPASPPA